MLGFKSACTAEAWIENKFSEKLNTYVSRIDLKEDNIMGIVKQVTGELADKSLMYVGESYGERTIP